MGHSAVAQTVSRVQVGLDSREIEVPLAQQILQPSMLSRLVHETLIECHCRLPGSLSGLLVHGGPRVAHRLLRVFSSADKAAPAVCYDGGASNKTK